MMTKIGIIIGSIRENAQSARIGDFILDQIKKLDPNCDVEIFALRTLDVPFWTEDKWKSDSEMVANWSPISKDLKSCDGFVVISPEWAGMVPPHLKNFLLMCDSGELAHKPAQIVAISSGMGGAYPIAELRMSGYKNNFITWLPDHVILRNVATLLVDEQPSKLDISVTDRIQYSMTFLLEMSTAMKPVREKNQNLKIYKFGM